VSNAIAHDERDAPVTVRLDEGASRATIEVRNLGVPNDKSALGTLFQLLMQGRGGEDRHRGLSGIGLGLYIFREIAAAHGVGVGVVSEAELGTTFTVTQLRAAQRAGAAAQAPHPRL